MRKVFRKSGGDVTFIFEEASKNIAEWSEEKVKQKKIGIIKIQDLTERELQERERKETEKRKMEEEQKKLMVKQNKVSEAIEL